MKRMSNTKSNRTICLLFNVHQPFWLKNYRFYNIGVDHNYYDEQTSQDILESFADECYLPANEALLNIIKKHGSKFRVTFALSGPALEQFKKHTPKVIESFGRLFNTGNVEFVAEPYAYSLAMLSNPAEYDRQVKKHIEYLKCMFGCRPTAFINPNLAYSANIGQGESDTIQGSGYPDDEDAKSMPGSFPSSDHFTESQLMLLNCQLKDDVTFRFPIYRKKRWPLNHRKFIAWMNSIHRRDKIVNLFMDYGKLWEFRDMRKEIFSFIPPLIDKIISSGKWIFRTVSESSQPDGMGNEWAVPKAIPLDRPGSRLTPWLGNKMQQAAFSTLYSIRQIMHQCHDKELRNDWNKLQTCDYFNYMSLKHLHKDDAYYPYFNPYDSPYKAFINYMNILSDFLLRVQRYDARPS